MVNTPGAVINASTVFTDKQPQPVLQMRPSQIYQNVAPAVENEQLRQILCCYVNNTSKVQITRITNISNWHFERVVFPGQRILFAARADAQLEIHTGTTITAILSDNIRCDRLRVSPHSTAF